MSTVYSKPNVILEARTNQDQRPNQESQIYSELFEECTNPNSDINYENDFDLFSVIVNAVNVAKSKCKISPFNSLSNKGQHNYKHPCGVCNKSVNVNQQAVQCTSCSKWVHRKCNGTSVKEYKVLMEEDENIPWQCIICDIDEMALKFPFGYQS